MRAYCGAKSRHDLLHRTWIPPEIHAVPARGFRVRARQPSALTRARTLGMPRRSQALRRRRRARRNISVRRGTTPASRAALAAAAATAGARLRDKLARAFVGVFVFAAALEAV